jgi:hypothetical protein
MFSLNISFSYRLFSPVSRITLHPLSQVTLHFEPKLHFTLQILPKYTSPLSQVTLHLGPKLHFTLQILPSYTSPEVPSYTSPISSYTSPCPKLHFTLNYEMSQVTLHPYQVTLHPVPSYTSPLNTINLIIRKIFFCKSC